MVPTHLVEDGPGQWKRTWREVHTWVHLGGGCTDLAMDGIRRMRRGDAQDAPLGSVPRLRESGGAAY